MAAGENLVGGVGDGLCQLGCKDAECGVDPSRGPLDPGHRVHLR